MSDSKSKNKQNAEGLQRCQGFCPDGSRCRKKALLGSEYCFSHDPSKAEERRDIARKGGNCPRRPDLPGREELTVTKARQLLSAASEMLLQGKLSATAARSLATLLSTDKMLREHGELIDRLDKIERDAAAASMR